MKKVWYIFFFINLKGVIYYACCEGFTSNKFRLKTLETIRRDGKFSSCLFKVFPAFYNGEYLKTKTKFYERMSHSQITSIERRATIAELPK